MNTMISSPPPVSSGFRVDISRGERIGRVSSEWFSRPDDERFLSLSDLLCAVSARTDRARVRTVESAEMRVEATRDNAERLALIVPGGSEPIAPTHWSYGQLCSLAGAPASYMRQLPAPLAAINLQHGLLNHKAELVKTLEMDDGRVELRAVTGPEYGRIWDKDLVAAVMSIAGNGTGDTIWKVPGVLDWSTMTHNPFVDITKDTTTLYASDRDVFLFLVDDTHPIEAGRLPNGEPDLYFRGFYAWNSEVGSKTLGIASFYLRAVCANRNLWGTENFEEITIRHSKFAAQRFAHEAAPALTNFANSSPAPFIAGIRAARERVVARNDEDRSEFLRKRGFSKAETGKIIETVLSEEGRPPESIFDLSRASPRLPAEKPIRTRGSNWRAKRGSCWKAQPDCCLLACTSSSIPFIARPLCRAFPHSENQCHDQYRRQRHLPPAHPSCPHHAARNAGSDQCTRMPRNRSDPCPVHRFRSDASDPREATRTERSLSRIGATRRQCAQHLHCQPHHSASLPFCPPGPATPIRQRQSTSTRANSRGRSWCRGTVARSLSLRGAVVRRRRFLISTTNGFFEGFTMVRLNKTDSCQCHRCSYRLARSTPPQLRVPVSRQSRHLALGHSPDPRCDLRSRVYHIGECLLVFISGACRHNEHRDGDGFLFGQCY